jgi:hypothetical protein
MAKRVKKLGTRNWVAARMHNRKQGAHMDRKKEDSRRACRSFDVQTDGYLEVIQRMSDKSGIRVVLNAPCIKCGALYEYQVQVGSVPFCAVCAEETFQTEDPPKMEPELYREWLKKHYARQVEEDGE